MQSAIVAFGKSQGWPEDLTFQVELIIEELAMNVIHHGGLEADSDDPIRIELTSRPDRLVIEFIDRGQAFDPIRDAPLPDTDSAIEDRPIGGLGVYLARKLSDEISYHRAAGRNHLVLTKMRTA